MDNNSMDCAFSDGLEVMMIKDHYNRLSDLFLRSSLVVLYKPYRRELR